jgi:hypothetical protein
MFFISVDSEEVRYVVSCLELTLVGWLASVAYKWVRAGHGLMGILARTGENKENDYRRVVQRRRWR